MDKFYDDILPCLKSVGTWWTEPDRRLLFCHLLMIFPINAEYLAELQAARYNDGVKQSFMNVHSIKNALQVFKKLNGTKKCTCAGIRGLEFSFGKLNPRVCYLCPYSGTYKNMKRSDERRFLYHIMIDESRCLSNYLELEGKKIENVFNSYFPVYVKDILVEAFPFLMFAEWFLGLESGFYKRNLKEAHDDLLEWLHKNIEQKIPYLRIKELIDKEVPDYKVYMKEAADAELNALEKENISTRPINEIMMIRLFRILASNKKYIHKNPEDYVTEDKALIVPNLFASPLLMESKEKNKKNITGDQSRDLMDDEPHKQSVFDDDLILGKTEPQLGLLALVDCKEKMKLDKKDVIRKDSEINGQNMFKDKMEGLIIEGELKTSSKIFNEQKDIEAIFKKIYCIERKDMEPCFIYGEHDRKKEDALLQAFVNDSRYFAIEPAEYLGMPGLLILNEENDYIFYSIDRYGAKPIRAIADKGIPIYTSNIYNTGRYLYCSKVQKIALHDVGVAVSLYKGIKTESIVDFSSVSFPECMKKYKDIYIECSMNLSKEQQAILKRMEAYVLLLCTDGEKPPFVVLDSLYMIKNSLKYEYLYKPGMCPIRDGVFLYLRAFWDKREIEGEVLKFLYMDTCIELSHKVPFYDGMIQILELSEKGLLLYVMGNKMFIQKTQLYLSSCARRAFAKVSVKGHPVTFEQMTQEYLTLKKE